MYIDSVDVTFSIYYLTSLLI